MSLSRRAFTAGLAASRLLKGEPQGAHEPQQVAVPASEVAGQWQPKIFDNHQLATVAMLADLIIPKTDTPGASEALVHQHLDHILSDSPEATRSKFLEGLWWLDGYCLRSTAKPFKDLVPDEQIQIVLALYETSDPDLQPGHVFVEGMKTWTAKIYYSTEIGQRELNKDGRVPSFYERDCSA